MALAVEGEQETGGQVCAVYKWPPVATPAGSEDAVACGRDRLTPVPTTQEKRHHIDPISP